PLISMISHIDRSAVWPQRVHFLYATKISDSTTAISQVLFLDRLVDIAKRNPGRFTLSLFVTGEPANFVDAQIGKLANDAGVHLMQRRLTLDDVTKAVGRSDERKDAVAYVCGPPKMTDEIVEHVQKLDRMERRRVFCEKWW
ncbi:hypothetical protein LTS18_013512, partial [Coniosporium uncinatum]